MLNLLEKRKMEGKCDGCVMKNVPDALMVTPLMIF